MNERVKIIRNYLGLSQEKFGNKIGIKKSAISLIENGHNNLTEQIIKSICREFNIDYIWLTTGQGDMFLEKSDELELHDMIDRLLAGNNKKVITLFKNFAKLSDADIACLNHTLDTLLSGYTNDISNNEEKESD